MNKYQSLVAWQSAHAFVILRRAALSIETNIVEGYALQTTAQFRRHLVIARGSAAECECVIRILLELGYIEQPEISTLASQVDLALKTLRGLIRSQLP